MPPTQDPGQTRTTAPPNGPVPASAMSQKVVSRRGNVTTEQIAAEFERQLGRPPTSYELQAVQSQTRDITRDVGSGKETLEERISRGMPHYSRQALEAQGVAQAGQTARIQDLLLPSVLADQGYEVVKDERGNIINIVKKEDPDADAFKAQENEILKMANETTLKGLKGEIDIDPSVEADITEGDAQLRAELLRKLGPGAEGSDSWNRAKAEFEKQANAMRYSIRHGQMTTADAMATNRANTQSRQQNQRYEQLQSTTSPFIGTAGMLAGTLAPWYQRQAQDREFRQRDRESRNALIGDALGAGGSAAGMAFGMMK